MKRLIQFHQVLKLYPTDERNRENFCILTLSSIFTKSEEEAIPMYIVLFNGTGGWTLESCLLSLLISSKVCLSRTGISPSESLSLKSKTEVSEELLNSLALDCTIDALAGAGAGAGIVAGTGKSSSVFENRRLLGGRQAACSRVSFGGLPPEEPDCGVDVDAPFSKSIGEKCERRLDSVKEIDAKKYDEEKTFNYLMALRIFPENLLPQV